MKRNLFNLLLFIFFFLFLNTVSSSGPLNKNIVYIIPVKGTIDLGLSAFIKRANNEAKNNNPAAVIFAIDTFGGRVDAADEISKEIQGLSPIPTYAYIENTAWSAGALIALSCKTILMKPGSSIGSAEPRTMSFFSEQQTSDEKTVSALRAKFKATAEANHHSPNLAQAMVDKDVELFLVKFKNEELILTKEELAAKKLQFPKEDLPEEKVISPAGKLLNLTAEDASALKLAAIVQSENDLLALIPKQAQALDKPEIIRPVLFWSENLVRFITHPIASSLLLSLGFLGLLFELKLPHWGISGTLGVIFLVLFFWGHYLAGLAQWEDILIFLIGFILLLIELFFIPGFGIVGISGIILMISGLILTLTRHPFALQAYELYNAFYVISYSFIFTFIILLFAVKFIPHTSFWKRLRLETREDKESGFQTKSLPENIYPGKIGKAKSLLRPAGRAVIDDNLYDVTTCGEFIDKDKPIKVVKIEGNKIFVEEIR